MGRKSIAQRKRDRAFRDFISGGSVSKCGGMSRGHVFYAFTSVGEESEDPPVTINEKRFYGFIRCRLCGMYGKRLPLPGPRECPESEWSAI